MTTDPTDRRTAFLLNPLGVASGDQGSEVPWTSLASRSVQRGERPFQEARHTGITPSAR
jgi:hypothetical protein